MLTVAWRRQKLSEWRLWQAWRACFSSCETAARAAARWMPWTHVPLGHLTPTRLLMVIGVMLLQLVTGNQLVRLVLGSVGAVRPASGPYTVA